MTVKSDKGQGEEKPDALLGTLCYLSPQNNSERPRIRDFIPFAAIFLAAAFDLVLCELRAASPPFGLFGAVVITFVVPSVVLLGASFYAMSTKPRASITLLIGGLLSAGAFFMHLVVHRRSFEDFGFRDDSTFSDSRGHQTKRDGLLVFIVILAVKPPG